MIPYISYDFLYFSLFVAYLYSNIREKVSLLISISENSFSSFVVVIVRKNNSISREM